MTWTQLAAVDVPIVSLTVPPGYGRRRWGCQYCTLSFESASTLNLHTLAHAAQDLEDTTLAADEEGDQDSVLGELTANQPLDCPECNKVRPAPRLSRV